MPINCQILYQPRSILMLTSIYWASNSSNTPSQILIIILFAKNEIPQLKLTKNDHYRHFIWKQKIFRNGKFDQFYLTFNILNIRYVLYNLILFVHIYFHLWTYLYVVRIFFIGLANIFGHFCFITDLMYHSHCAVI